MVTKIKKIGFEIEGEFSSKFEEDLQALGIMKDDGSVRTCYDLNGCSDCIDNGCDGYCLCPCHDCAEDVRQKHSNNLSAGEYNSKPLSPNLRVARKILLIFQKAWNKKEYHNNESAGLHIHFSFCPDMPVEVWSLQFQRYFLSKLRKKYPEVYEARKGNRYCKVRDTNCDVAYGDDRHSAINFLSAYEKFGTIEVRFWQADEPLKMYDYLKFTRDCIESFIKNANTSGGQLKEVIRFQINDKKVAKKIKASVAITPKVADLSTNSFKICVN